MIGLSFTKENLKGENALKGTRGTNVKVLFQGLHMTRVPFLCWFIIIFLVFWIPNLTLHVKYKCVLTTN
jgi:hypothetical protein